MRLKWHKKAKTTFRGVSTYIRQEFGLRSQQDFLRQVLATVNLLCRHPHLGPVEPLLADMPKTYRSFVIKPYNKIIYTISDDTIEIVAVWDTRRNPAALTEELP